MFRMAKLLIAVFALSCGLALADDSGYGAPSSYQSAGSSYGVPSAPADNYGTPDVGYGVPSYGEPASGYGAPVAEDDGGDLFKFDKILELLPFFLAVFAAIILAQLLTPLLGALSGIITPFGNIKIDFINLLLGPFSLAICNTNPLSLAGSGKRSFPDASGFFSNPETIDTITSALYDAVKRKFILVSGELGKGHWHWYPKFLKTLFLIRRCF